MGPRSPLLSAVISSSFEECEYVKLITAATNEESVTIIHRPTECFLRQPLLRPSLQPHQLEAFLHEQHDVRWCGWSVQASFDRYG